MINKSKALSRTIPSLSIIDRDEFIAPFDRLIDQMIQYTFPKLSEEFGVDFFEKGGYPKVDIKEHTDKIIIEAEVPGLTKDDIEIKVEDGYLVLICNKREEVNEEGVKYVRREIRKSRSHRTFVLNDNINKDDINAEFKNGTLTITLNKIKPDTEVPAVKKIEIK